MLLKHLSFISYSQHSSNGSLQSCSMTAIIQIIFWVWNLSGLHAFSLGQGPGEILMAVKSVSQLIMMEPAFCKASTFVKARIFCIGKVLWKEKQVSYCSQASNYLFLKKKKKLNNFINIYFFLFFKWWLCDNLQQKSIGPEIPSLLEGLLFIYLFFTYFWIWGRVRIISLNNRLKIRINTVHFNYYQFIKELKQLVSYFN